MKNLILLLCLSIGFIAKGQESEMKEIDTRANSFFESYEDYQANKPIEGVKLAEMSFNTVKIDKDGKIVKVKEANMPSSWFCDEQGILMRVFDKNIYFVIVDGAICHYVKFKEANAQFPYNPKTNLIRTDYIFQPWNSEQPFREYYSESITSEILVLKGKYWEELLTKYDLKKQYDSDKLKREAKDSVLDYKNKEWRKKVKYKKLINEKIKEN
ncbi:MAG: hypothetical protein HXX09_09555 [Bacteroidetes bacterium]|nr:hypothetical protein [Bacteroidota bacterium]